jgi:hypothetical protein
MFLYVNFLRSLGRCISTTTSSQQGIVFHSCHEQSVLKKCEIWVQKCSLLLSTDFCIEVGSYECWYSLHLLVAPWGQPDKLKLWSVYWVLCIQSEGTLMYFTLHFHLFQLWNMWFTSGDKYYAGILWSRSTQYWSNLYQLVSIIAAHTCLYMCHSLFCYILVVS